MTRTYAILEIEQTSFDDIVGKLTIALKDDPQGTDRYFLQDGNIALEGVALKAIPGGTSQQERTWDFKYVRDNLIAQEGDESEPLRVLKAVSVEKDEGHVHGYVALRGDDEVLWVDEDRAVDYTSIV